MRYFDELERKTETRLGCVRAWFSKQVQTLVNDFRNISRAHRCRRCGKTGFQTAAGYLKNYAGGDLLHSSDSVRLCCDCWPYRKERRLHRVELNYAYKRENEDGETYIDWERTVVAVGSTNASEVMASIEPHLITPLRAKFTLWDLSGRRFRVVALGGGVIARGLAV